MEEKNEYIIFTVSGGHGKCIMATAVIEAIKKKYPNKKIVVISAWDAPFYNNPNIHRFYQFGQMQYFYDDYIKNHDDTIVFNIDPYHTEDYIMKRKHLLDIWCELCGVEYDGEQPKIYLNPREIEIAKDKIKPDSGKPIMLLQTHGGLPSSQYSKKSWSRDLPIEIAQKLANYYSKSYRVLHLRLDEQPVLKNTEPVTLPHRELYAVFEFSKKRLFIDSFAQHTAAALNLPSTVCWISNKPETFGYDIHNNVLPNVEIKNEMNKFSFLEQFDITGQIQQFPYDTVNVFDINEIMDSLK